MEKYKVIEKLIQARKEIITQNGITYFKTDEAEFLNKVKNYDKDRLDTLLSVYLQAMNGHT